MTDAVYDEMGEILTEIQDGRFAREWILENQAGRPVYNALKRMGYKYVPVYLVDYSSAHIAVAAWRDGEHVTKAEVMRAGLSGNLMPAKTSRHTVPDMPHGVNVPLAVLEEKPHGNKFHP